MDRAKITLSGRAKVGGAWRRPGETLTVDTEIAGQLEDAGVLSAPPVPAVGGADALLARAVEAEAQRDMLEQRVLVLQAEVEVLAEDRDASRARATEAEAEMGSLTARNHELEAEIADLKAASASVPDTGQQDTPPSKPRRPPARRAQWQTWADVSPIRAVAAAPRPGPRSGR